MRTNLKVPAALFTFTKDVFKKNIAFYAVEFLITIM